MSTTTAPRPSARQRLLDAAAELFYAEGIHTVGIDRVIEKAGVAKASLYNTFGSKDELVRAYLQQRHAATQARVEAALERWDTPRDKLVGIFVSQGERMREPDYCGCPFVAATAESPADSPARAATADYRAWILGTFADLAAEAGVADPDGLARQLVMVYDGAAVSFRVDGDASASATAQVSAAALVDAALPR